jgi:ankyrin repeat protein
VEVVELLVEKGANHEHLSEGGRTPLMKACRGGHVEVIKFLLSKGADVNRTTASNDHTPLSLACAGGHIAAVEVLLAAGANPYHKLKDNSTMIIEAARGGHTNVIRALLDFAPVKGDGKGHHQGPGGKVVTKGQAMKGQQQQAVDSSKTSKIVGYKNEWNKSKDGIW